MQRKDIVIRDTRTKSHFVVDDEYLNGYARHCGPNATLVYLCLCRHADKGQSSFPSIQTMAEKTGISVRSVKRGIQELLDWRIIIRDRVRNPETGRWWNNSYTLTDKSQWKPKPPEATQAHGPGATGAHRPGAKSDIHQGPHRHTKESHSKKDSHTTRVPAPASAAEDETEKQKNKDAAELIDAFKNVNPSHEQLFKRKPQKDAARRLVEKWGLRRMQNAVAMLEITNPERYAPTITTPVQLEEKLGALSAFVKKQQGTKPKLHI